MSLLKTVRIRNEYIFLVLIVIITMVLEYLFNEHKTLHLFKYNSQSVVSHIEYHLSKDSKNIEKYYRYLMTSLIREKEFIHYIKSRDKEQLYKRVVNRFKGDIEKSIYLKSLNIYLENGDSLINLNSSFKQREISENLNRKIISLALTTKEIESGFEFTNGELIYQVIEPIYKGNEFIGLFEVSIGFDYFIDNVISGSRDIEHLILFLNKELFDKNIETKYIKAGEYYLYHNRDHKIVNKFNITPYKANDIRQNSMGTYSIDELIVRDFYSNSVGKLVIIRDITEIDEFIKGDIHSTTVVIAIIVLFNTIAFIFLYRKYQQNIDKKQRELHTTIELFSKGESVLLKWRASKNSTKAIPTYVSDNTEVILGYKSRSILEGLIDYRELIVDSDQKRINKKLSELNLLPVKQIKRLYYKVKRRDGRVIWVYESIKRVETIDWDSYYLSYLMDITNQKELEESLQQVNSRLEKLNSELQDEVDKKVEEIRIQENALLQQSKLAAMGEMIGAISHQWRQPLNSIAGNIQFLDDDFDDNLIDKSYINKFIDNNMIFINFMSKTIDDFRNFFKADKTKSIYSVYAKILEIESIFDPQFKSNSIELSIENSSFDTLGYPREFQQVILNLINNAKDSILSNSIKNGKIKVKINVNLVDKVGIVTVSDNGGGVPKNIENRIFEPYFSTKQDRDGTGIGLYMSKIIIEKNSGGKLYLKNIDGGASFIIELPLNVDEGLNIGY